MFFPLYSYKLPSFSSSRKRDDAARQFQIAINLKPDYANAYYNLGHTYENQNKLPEALQMYQQVQGLVANDQPNLDVINKEITALQAKIGEATKAAGNIQPSANQENLGVNEPEAQLPEREILEKKSRDHHQSLQLRPKRHQHLTKTTLPATKKS